MHNLFANRRPASRVAPLPPGMTPVVYQEATGAICRAVGSAVNGRARARPARPPIGTPPGPHAQYSVRVGPSGSGRPCLPVRCVLAGRTGPTVRVFLLRFTRRCFGPNAIHNVVFQMATPKSFVTLDELFLDAATSSEALDYLKSVVASLLPEGWKTCGRW